MPGSATRWVRLHAVAFGVANAAFLAIDLLTPGSVWFIYPLLFWGGALAMHHYLVKTLGTDPDWAERRAERLRRHSYDIAHIESIEAAAKAADQPRPDGGSRS